MNRALRALGHFFGLTPHPWETDPACHECDACTAPVRDIASLVLTDGDWRPVERLVPFDIDDTGGALHPHICGG